jgi:hypothetical protein
VHLPRTDWTLITWPAAQYEQNDRPLGCQAAQVNDPAVESIEREIGCNCTA